MCYQRSKYFIILCSSSDLYFLVLIGPCTCNFNESHQKSITQKSSSSFIAPLNAFAFFFASSANLSRGTFPFFFSSSAKLSRGKTLDYLDI